MVTLSLTHDTNELLLIIVRTLYILTITIPFTTYLLLLHITHHFLTFLISFVNFFNILLILAYRHTSNLRDILVKAKPFTNATPNNTSSVPGSLRCEQDCTACPYITNRLTHKTFLSTGATRQITSHVNCNTKNLINVIQCIRFHFQFIGETKAWVALEKKKWDKFVLITKKMSDSCQPRTTPSATYLSTETNLQRSRSPATNQAFLGKTNKKCFL